MSITAIERDLTQTPSIVRITASDTLATVAGANYLLNQESNITALNSGTFQWQAGDIVAVAASDGSEFFRFSGTNFDTLIQMPGGNGAVTLPVTNLDFAVFDGTLGALKDNGYLASDSTKTRVVMAGSAVVANHIAKFVDTTGTVDDTAGVAINSGDIQAGLSGTAGKLISYPATGAKGSLQVVGVENTGDTVTTLSNDAMGQASTINIPDPANAIGQFLIGATATPFVSGNFPAASGTAGLMVDSGFGTNNILQYAEVDFTAAQWNGMYAAPVQLVAAPGANKIIVVDRVVLDMTFVAAQYANGGVVAAQYDSTVHGAGAPASATIAAATINGYAASTGIMVAGAMSSVAFTNMVNKGLFLSNDTGAFTTGDGTWKVHVWYHIVATA